MPTAQTMPNAKCRPCSKIIPDGFTDCPWCGAKQQQASGLQTSLPVRPQPGSSAHAADNPLLWSAFLCSFTLFCFLQYKQMLRIAGEVSLANSAFFLGQCAGSFIVAAILVFLFDKIRHRNPSPPTRLLAISAVACVMSVLALASPQSSRRLVLGSLGQAINNPSQPHLDKWGLAARPLCMELVSRNRQYLDEVSKLDAALQPLYSPASFRDAASVQAMLDALAQRLAIADKYADIQPVLAKMPGYIAAVDATDKEKQEFLAGFDESIAKGLRGKNSVSAWEHNWIASAVDLYKFSLAHPYSYNVGNILFKSAADAVAFNSKLNKSRDFYARFLRAYQTSRCAEDALSAQTGFQRPDISLDGPQ